MHVYVDESGTFSIPRQATSPAVSCCGALTLPTERKQEVFSGFEALTRDWPRDRGELKGWLLSEEHFSAALAYFVECKLLVELVAIDLGLHETGEVYRHKQGAADNIARNREIAIFDSAKQELRGLETVLRGSSAPTYIQSVLMTELMNNVARTNLRWFSLAEPEKLSAFSWVIDAKDRAPTEMERLWTTLLFPWLEARFLNDPLVCVSDRDYSHVPDRLFGESPTPPEHLAPDIKIPAEPFSTIDIKAMFKDLRFADSRDDIGLQMVDIAVSAARRAMMGNLQREGWKQLGSLLVRPAEDRKAIGLVDLGTGDRRWEPCPLYERVVLQLRREMLPVVPIDPPV